MKVYMPDVGMAFRPGTQSFVWPPRNKEPGQDRGVEQDFAEWLASSTCRTASLAEADWVYIPIYWNRWWFANLDEDRHWGGSSGARAALQAEVDRLSSLIGNKRWFTISEADPYAVYSWLDLRGMVVFCSSRRQAEKGIDIPLLAAPHPAPQPGWSTPKKRLLCFQGHMMMDGWRIKLRELLGGQRADCLVEHANHGPDVFANTIRESYVALAPRGQGGQSFRFYEAMQLGVPPLYIADYDYRPFQKWVNWQACSLHMPATSPNDLTAERVNQFLDRLAEDPARLLEMGRAAEKAYCADLGYRAWCRYVLKELEAL